MAPGGMPGRSPLTTLARQQLASAKAASSARSASTVFGGHENIMRRPAANADEPPAGSVTGSVVGVDRRQARRTA